MSKNHRGKGLLEKPKGGRGVCPVCKRTGVKIVYEREIDKAKVNVCKICNSVLNKKPKKAAEAKSEPKQEGTQEGQ
jgi:ribosome-binding protein aMBF1 (putative translation factor)